MDECPGSGRELPDDPPANRAATCPVCGRETNVDDRETEAGLRFSVASHDVALGGP